MAASSFFKINNGCGIKNSNKLYIERNYLVSSTARIVEHPFPSHRQQQKSIIMSTQKHARRECLIKCMAAEAMAPVNEEENGIMAREVKVPIEDEDVKEEEEEEIPRSTLIWRAIKLPMYTVAFTPVTVGAAVAYWQTGVFSSFRYFLVLASYILVIVWVNLSNDVYDFDTGVDVNKKESVVNLFGGRSRINFIAWFLLAIGFSGLSWAAMLAGSPRSIVLVASAVFCFYLYQCPPFRLSYYGVGEPLLFIGFGPLSTIAFYLLQSVTRELPVTSTAVWSSVMVGLTTSLILFCSHFHQIKDDKAVGKMSPLVRLGTERGFQVVKMSIIGLYSALLGLGVTQALPIASVILCAMTLPMGNLVVSFVEKNHKDKTKIFMSKYLCVRLHTIFGLGLAAGLAASRMLAGKQFQLAMNL